MMKDSFEETLRNARDSARNDDDWEYQAWGFMTNS